MAGKDERKQKSESPLKVALAVALIFAAVLAAYWLFSSAPREEGGASIEVFLDSKGAVFEGEQLAVKAFSSCGKFDLFLDRKKLAEGETRAQAAFVANVGKHVIEAKGNGCDRKLEFEAVARQCNDGEEQDCAIGSCTGRQACAAGRFGNCVLPKKVCVPGTKTGCTLNSCQFGYRICNECGTGYSDCSLEGNASASCGAANSSCT